MAAERESSAIPASGLGVVLALVLGFAVVHELPLEKYRPVKVEKNSEQLIDLQDAEARLWQDPFAAVQRHHEEVDKLLQNESAPLPAWAKAHIARHEFKALRTDIETALQAGVVTILAVTVSGAPYTEDIERRQRFRYAALAGLNRGAFTPENGDHIGYVITGRPDSQKKCNDSARLPEKIPFEWFTPIPTEPNNAQPVQRKVLLLWLSEHALSKEPIKGLKAFTDCLGVNTENPRLSTKLLGPATSDTLRRLVEQISTEPEANSLRLQVYSPFATADRKALLRGLDGVAEIPFCAAHAETSKPGVCLVRTTVTDDTLAKSIVDELEKRGVDLCQNNAGPNCVPDRVALVSEWDTFYGRNLPQAISSIVCPDKALLSDCNTILQSSYLQGIDGTIPGDGSASPSANGSPPKREQKEQTMETARGERAEGRHQFDYLRRLVDRLKQQNAEWEGHKGEIKAIGILGSDVYDKLLVLQALRSEFPQAQFFTTDLDARLLHPQEFKSARNIVVASGYGLRLRSELQGDIPPFRDSYQTALFYTTLLAIAPGAGTPAQAEVNKQMKPRVFEIGRRNAYGLDRDGDNLACDQNQPLACANIHPDDTPNFAPRWLYKGLWLYLPIFFLLLVVGVPLYARRKLRGTSSRDLSIRLDPVDDDLDCGISSRIALDVAREILDRRRARAFKYFIVTSIALIPLLHLAAVLLLGQRFNYEPVTFYEGISVWPTEALRIYAGVLAVFLTYWAMLRVETNQLELTGWFFPRCRKFGIPEFEFNRQGVWTSIRANLTKDSLKRIFAGDLLIDQPADQPKDQIKARQFWRQCAFHSSLAACTIRTTVAAVAFYVFSLTFLWILGLPHTPYRGNFSKYVDMFAVVVWSTPPLLFLTFYVVDATLLCKRFISALSDGHTEWPNDTRKYFGAVKVDPKNAAPEQTPEIKADEHPETRQLPVATESSHDLEEAYDDWIDIQLIAQRTSVVSSLVYYPLLVMLLLLFARSTLFDNWHWPAGMVIPLAISIIVIAACYVVLRQEAERARRIAYAKVAHRLLVAKGQGAAAATLVAQFDLMLKNIEEIREGAFAPFTHQPLIKALLIFFSASGLAFLEYFGVISF